MPFVSVGGSAINYASSISPKAHFGARVCKSSHRQSECSKREVAADDNRPLVDQQLHRKLVSTLQLLRYAEAELSELNLETSVVLLRAAIVDIAQNVGIACELSEVGKHDDFG
ncbi:hypothetical protein [Bradyrhizobium sp. USDA 4506]